MRRMPPIFFSRFAVLITFLLSFHFAKSQALEGCIFLQGNYVEVGIAPNGAFGTPASAPAGYHSRPTPLFNALYNPVTGISQPRSGALGFVADYGKDGWSTGNPAYFGDYFMPGTVQEGFSIQVNGVKSNAWSNNYQTFGSSGFTGPLTGTNQLYDATATEKKGVWEGMMGDLLVRQTINLKNTKAYFTANVVLKNTGPVALTNIYYMRTVDPDNEVSVTSSFVTKNKIAYQLPNTFNKTLVTATGLTHGSYLGLGTKDCQAKCFYMRSGLMAEGDLAGIYNGFNPAYSYADSLTSDVAIGLIFDIGTLNPGDSTSFSYAYILSEADLDDAFAETDPGFMYNGTFYPSGSVIVQPTGTVLPISIVNGSYYNWTWSPATFLNTTIGPLVDATVSTGPITYTVSGVGTGTIASRCSNRTLNITVSPVPVSPPPSLASSVIYYCMNQPPGPLSASGPGIIRWYTTATGGTGSLTPPTPSTAVPGTFTWYVTQETGGVESIRIPVTVIVKPPPTVAITPAAPAVCYGDTVRLIASGALATYAWSPATTLSASSGDTVHAFPLVNTTYTIVATDTTNCTNNVSVTVTIKQLPTVSITPPSGIVCKGDSILLTAGGSGVSYTWDAAAGLSTTTGTAVWVKPPVTTTYNVTGTSSNGCSAKGSSTISVTPPPIPSLGPDKSICIGSTLVLNPGSFASYQWHDGAASSTYPVSNVGLYWVNVTDGFGCKATDSIRILSLLQLPKDFLPNDMAFCRGNQVALKVSGYSQYLWSTGATTPKVTVDKFGQYKLTVTDNNGCAGTDSITLFDAKCIPYIVPNGFTPNGDGLNDYFRPLITQLVKGYKMSIYNRWGQVIYETTNSNTGWDGTFGGVKQAAGVYVYHIRFTDADGQPVLLKGTVTLIR
ncbi:MAG: gliding motility-associated C-terminal domain-containing protein [Chitinophagaceae bacterium]|nr:gliding motility-associated C-terminal domain-containing protein [Chitinophagaceae bacterium]